MEPFRLSSKGPFELCLRVGPADLGDVLVLNLTHVHLFDDDDDDDHDHDDDDDDDDGKWWKHVVLVFFFQMPDDTHLYTNNSI